MNYAVGTHLDFQKKIEKNGRKWGLFSCQLCNFRKFYSINILPPSWFYVSTVTNDCLYWQSSEKNRGWVRIISRVEEPNFFEPEKKLNKNFRVYIYAKRNYSQKSLKIFMIDRCICFSLVTIWRFHAKPWPVWYPFVTRVRGGLGGGAQGLRVPWLFLRWF